MKLSVWNIRISIIFQERLKLMILGWSWLWSFDVNSSTEIEDSDVKGLTVMSCYATTVTLGWGYVIPARQIMPGPFSCQPFFCLFCIRHRIIWRYVICAVGILVKQSVIKIQVLTFLLLGLFLLECDLNPLSLSVVTLAPPNLRLDRVPSAVNMHCIQSVRV